MKSCLEVFDRAVKVETKIASSGRWFSVKSWIDHLRDVGMRRYALPLSCNMALSTTSGVWVRAAKFSARADLVEGPIAALSNEPLAKSIPVIVSSLMH